MTPHFQPAASSQLAMCQNQRRLFRFSREQDLDASVEKDNLLPKNKVFFTSSDFHIIPFSPYLTDISSKNEIEKKKRKGKRLENKAAAAAADFLSGGLEQNIAPKRKFNTCSHSALMRAQQMDSRRWQQQQQQLVEQGVRAVWVYVVLVLDQTQNLNGIITKSEIWSSYGGFLAWPTDSA